MNFVAFCISDIRRQLHELPFNNIHDRFKGPLEARFPRFGHRSLPLFGQNISRKRAAQGFTGKPSPTG
jgi:hypothetical protein